MTPSMAQEERIRIEELVARLRELADAVVIEHVTLTTRNAAVTMLDAAATLVELAFDGVEP